MITRVDFTRADRRATLVLQARLRPAEQQELDRLEATEGALSAQLDAAWAEAEGAGDSARAAKFQRAFERLTSR